MIPPRRHPESGPFVDIYRALNELRDYAVSIRPSNGTGTTVRHTSVGTIINAVQQKKSLEISDLVVCLVKSESDNTLTCALLDDEGEEESEITVKKPWNLRGYSASRTISITGGTVTETITPAYTALQSLIVVSRMRTFSFTSENDVTSDGVSYLDINVDARHWRVGYKIVCAKVNGVDRRMPILGGEPI